jgi:phage tail sheath protein FI
MAEKILSPGVFQNESDRSLVQRGIQGTSTAIVGPTVLGQPFVPTYVTSYSEFVAKFGETFKSGSYYYEYLTSLSAKDYFNNGGKTLLVTKIISGSGNVSTYAQSAVYDLSAIAATASLALTGSTFIITGSGLDGSYFSLTGSTDSTATTASVFGRFYITSSTNQIDSSPNYYIVTGSSATATISNIVTKINSLSSTFNITASVFSTFSMSLQAVNIYDDNETLGNQFKLVTGSTSVTFSGARNASAAFTLETLAWGDQMNNSGGAISGSFNNGALPSGSSTNVRWEITNVNTGSGTFNLAIRAGNDNNSQKNYIESWPNLSLDPNLPNYISRVIGDIKPVYSSNSDGSYIDYTGSYANASQYVRVKSVTTPQVDSIDNNGYFKTGSYASGLPTTSVLSSNGAFSGGVAATTATQLMNENITITNIQGFAPADYTTAFGILRNKDEYQFNVLLAPGIGLDNSAVSTFISTCENRGDAIALTSAGVWGTSITAATTFAAGQSSNYAATYYPWISLYSSGLGKAVWCPPTTIMGGVLAFNDQVGAEWFAPAGLNRGGVPSVLKAEKRLSQSDRDTLYSANVNPLATFPGEGVVVFGQKTLQRKATALDRVNVRRLLIALKGYIGQVANNLVFEQNTNVTRNRFLAQVNPYLESVVQRQGLYAFKVVMDDTNNTADVIDRNQLVGQIYIQPTKTAEFIILNYNILPTGATFPA